MSVSRTRSLSVGALTAAVCLLCGAGGASPAAGAERDGLRTGFTDSAVYQSTDPAVRGLGLARTGAVGGSIVRLLVEWPLIAPDRPPSRQAARDPGWTGYRWEELDAWVRDARAAGLQPLLVLYLSPAWAEAPGRPAGAPPSTWKPSAQAFGDFARAAAGRYSGRAADAQGQPLPRVRYWQGWNEPNLASHLTPQWRRSGGGYRLLSANAYRAMLNAFYTAVKGVRNSNLVVTAGTSPYGDPAGGTRTQPAYFWRELLCVTREGRLRAKRSCPGGPVRFDALAHHPYAVRGPSSPAKNADDVSIPDLRRITRPLAVALEAGNVSPRRAKQLWVTEVSYDSAPPDPGAVPLARHATYLESALSVLWRQGADVVAWFLLRDHPEGRGWAYGLQSGIFFRGGSIAQDTPKPARTAFRFPFTAYRADARSVRLWGLAPSSGKVVLERQDGAGWTAVRRLYTQGDRLFAGTLDASTGTVLRARHGTDTSLPWTVARRGQDP